MPISCTPGPQTTALDILDRAIDEVVAADYEQDDLEISLGLVTLSRAKFHLKYGLTIMDDPGLSTRWTLTDQARQ